MFNKVHVDATVAKVVGEAPHLGIAEHSVPRERVQQRTAEQDDYVPQFLEEIVEGVTLVPRERVQQRTAEQVEDAPQSRKETIEVAKSGFDTRPRGIEKQSVTTEFDIAVTLSGVGISWPRELGHEQRRWCSYRQACG